MIGEFSDGMLVDLDTGKTWSSAAEWLRDPDDWTKRRFYEVAELLPLGALG